MLLFALGEGREGRGEKVEVSSREGGVAGGDLWAVVSMGVVLEEEGEAEAVMEGERDGTAHFIQYTDVHVMMYVYMHMYTCMLNLYMCM